MAAQVGLRVFETQFLEPLRELVARYNEFKAEAAALGERLKKAGDKDARAYVDTQRRLNVLSNLPAPDEREVERLTKRLRILFRAWKVESASVKDSHKHFLALLRALRTKMYGLLVPALRMYAVLSKEVRVSSGVDWIKKELDGYKKLYHDFWFPSHLTGLYNIQRDDEPAAKALLHLPIGKKAITKRVGVRAVKDVAGSDVAKLVSEYL